MREFEMLIDLPYLAKGNKYAFDDETAFVYRIGDDGKPFEYPLRTGLAGYLWLLLTDRYLKEF